MYHKKTNWQISKNKLITSSPKKMKLKVFSLVQIPLHPLMLQWTLTVSQLQMTTTKLTFWKFKSIIQRVHCYSNKWFKINTQLMNMILLKKNRNSLWQREYPLQIDNWTLLIDSKKTSNRKIKKKEICLIN